MYDLGICFLSFACSIAAHVFFCRGLPKNQLHAKLFVGVAFFTGGLGWLARSFLANPFEGDTAFPATAVVIYLLLIPAYLIFYVTTELNSPSKLILRMIRQTPGIAHSEILKNFTNEELILPRLSDLRQTGCVELRDDCYFLSASGRSLGQFLVLYQKILGRDLGG
jgi:hypothetical protein